MRTLEFSQKAEVDLKAIGHYNIKTYGQAQAKAYLSFLEDHFYSIAQNALSFATYPHFSGIHYKIAKRRSRGHGYAILFHVSDEVVTILRILHTARDWLNPCLLSLSDHP